MRERHQSPVSKSSISDCLSSMSGTPPPARCLETVIIIFTTEDRFLVLNKKKNSHICHLFLKRKKYSTKLVGEAWCSFLTRHKGYIDYCTLRAFCQFFFHIYRINWKLTLIQKLNSYIIINHYISKCNYTQYIKNENITTKSS